MKALRRIDLLAEIILVTGAINSSLSVADESPTNHLARKNRNAVKAFYGLLGAATIYKALRSVAPKTKEEQRIAKMTELYNQAESYQKRANLYRQTAEMFLKRRF